jgi:translation initiation factor IF-3
MSKDNRCVNEEIVEHRVNIVLEDGTLRKNVLRTEALLMAEEENLDLVQVSSERGVPICKLMDYGKIKYKELKIKKKKQSKDVVKEIKFGLNISDHDLEIKHKKIIEFLNKKYKVRYILEIRGRVTDNILDLAKIKMKNNLSLFEKIATWQEQKNNNNNNNKSIVTVLIPIVK